MSAEFVTLEEVDDLRKDAQRLVDKAIRQYKVAKRVAAIDRTEYPELERRVKVIKENYPQSEWTPEQMAIVKELEDRKFRASLSYDYEDDWDEWGEDV